MRRWSVAAASVWLLIAAVLIASCAPKVDCASAQDSGTFIGRLVKVDGSSATFRVEKVVPNPSPSAGALPHPERGRLVVVHYGHDEQQFLHVGRRYSVKVWPINGFSSSVHTTDDACSGGTVYANGAAIDTSLWQQSIPRRALFGAVVAFAIAGALTGALMTRRRRRQRANVQAIRQSAP